MLLSGYYVNRRTILKKQLEGFMPKPERQQGYFPDRLFQWQRCCLRHRNQALMEPTKCFGLKLKSQHIVFQIKVWVYRPYQNRGTTFRRKSRLPDIVVCLFSISLRNIAVNRTFQNQDFVSQLYILGGLQFLLLQDKIFTFPQNAITQYMGFENVYVIFEAI